MLITRVPATSSVEDRAKVLDEQIAKYLPGRDINLVAHSMGGLDCRHLATHMNPMRYNIVSITTISTPHQGSSFADYMIDDVIGRHRLPGLLSNLPNRVVPLFSGDGKAFEGLTTKSMTRFNEQTPDLPTIKYFSYAARHDPGMFDTWRYPWSIIGMFICTGLIQSDVTKSNVKAKMMDSSQSKVRAGVLSWVLSSE